MGSSHRRIIDSMSGMMGLKHTVSLHFVHIQSDPNLQINMSQPPAVLQGRFSQ